MSQNFTPIHHLITDKSSGGSAKTDHSSTVPDIGTPKYVSTSKEAAPSIKQPVEILPIHEAVEKQEVEPDLKPYIEIKQQNMKISEELKQLGLQPIEKSKYADFQNIKLPLADDKIALGLNAPFTSSLRWLATFALYLLQQSHLTLKVIHGRAVRVIKR
jgi:hypothetical protein